MKIITIASGKGGVGKSIIASNVAIALGKEGKKVTLLDLDLGSSNLQLMLGATQAKTGIGHLILDPQIPVEKAINPTLYKNLNFIPGEMELPGLADIPNSVKGRIREIIQSVKGDYLIIDLGAGSHRNSLDFFLTGDINLLVVTPHPTSLLSGYLFLKSCTFFLLVKSFARESPASTLLLSLRKTGDLQRILLKDLLKDLNRLDEEGVARFSQSAKLFLPRLIVNQLNDPSDLKTSEKLLRSVKHFLDLDLHLINTFYHSKGMKQALKSRLPMVEASPKDTFSQSVMRLARRIIEVFGEGGERLSLDEIENDLYLDFSQQEKALEDLLHTGELSQGDLIDATHSQNIALKQLKNENTRLRQSLQKAIDAGFSPDA